ncbi:hypothetical protein BDW69DRAFT_180497 [Aspergillus filifer]
MTGEDPICASEAHGMECVTVTRLAKGFTDSIDQYMHYYTLLQDRGPAQAQEVQCLKTHFRNHPHAIAAEKKEYIDANDLFPAHIRRPSPIRKALEKQKRFRLFYLWRKYPPKPELPYYQSPYINYSSDKRIDRAAGALKVLFYLTMLMAPFWILAKVHATNWRLGNNQYFCPGLLLVPCPGHQNRTGRNHALAATAGYFAVLGLFLQAGSQGL